MELEILRKKLKQIKEEKGINIGYFAKQIGIQKSSFYNFVSGAKGLSEEKKELLKEQLRRFE